MFEKCIACNTIGEHCVPNFILLPFPDLLQWCFKRQKYLGWTNQMWADKSKVPIGTINRIKAGDYLDCRYSTIRSLLISLIGGTTEEFPCAVQVEKELEQQALKLAALEKENAMLCDKLDSIDELHRKDIRAIREEYQEQISFLKDDLRAWHKIKERVKDGE